MRWRRIRAVARKEALHVLRDPRSLGLAVALPGVMLLLFGYALTLDVDRVPLVVWDQSASVDSRELVSRFSGSRYFDLRRHVSGYAELERAVDTREALAGLVVPREFAQTLRLGRPTCVQLIMDGSDANTATLAASYAEALVRAFSLQTVVQAVRRSGAAAPALPVDLRARVWYNPDLESRHFIVPGLMAVILMVIAALLTSLTVAREWEQGTMEMLIATPLGATELVVGKLLPYVGLGAVDVAVAILMGEFLFHVPLRGSLWLLAVLITLFLAGSLSLGMWFGIVTRSQLLATQMAVVLTFLPAFLLSGFVYPVANMPLPIQGVTYLIPARYLVTALRGVYLKGVGLEVLWPQVLVLGVFAVAMTAVAGRSLHKRLV